MILQRSKNSEADIESPDLMEMTVKDCNGILFSEKIEWKAWPEGQPYYKITSLPEVLLMQTVIIAVFH